MIILFFLLVLAFSTSQAQDWAPVRGGEVYHYKLDYGTQNNSTSVKLRHIAATPIVLGQNGITSSWGGLRTTVKPRYITFQFDTFWDSLGNQHYTPKPRLEHCSTCVQSVEFRPVPLYPKVTNLASGDYQLILGTDTIEVAENPAQTAFHDTTQHLMTQVNYVGVSNWVYHPVTDSIVSISVRSDTAPFAFKWFFVLSKNHGITYLEDSLWNFMDIVGKEGSNPVGYQSLQFDDIFDFNVGDQFYYEDDHFSTHGVCTNFFPPIYLYNIAKYRHKILQRQDIGSDTIIYTIERIDYDTRCSNSLMIDTFTQTYTSHPLHYYNAREGYWTAYFASTPYSFYLTAKEYFNNEDLKYVGYDYGVDTSTYPRIGAFQTTDSITYNYDRWGTVYLYKKGLGALYAEDDYFENYSKRKLLGYIKGADTVGQTPAILITGVQDVMKQPKQLSISPNPASSTLSLSQAISGQVTFYNHLGQIVYQTVVEEVTELSVNELPVGSYWVHWQNETATLRQKVLIIR